MAAQTTVSRTNGAARNRPRPVVPKVGEFAHDLVTLAELQAQLLLIDVRQCSKSMVVPIGLGLCGLAMGLGVFPILLATLALVLHETLALSLAAAFGIAIVVGLGTSALLGLLGWRRLRKETTVFQRSQSEFVRNVKWVKEVLRNEGSLEIRSNQPVGDR